MATVDGYINLFPRDTTKGAFTPHPLSLVYPTGDLARLHGDRRAPMRAVKFTVNADEFFQVQRSVDPNARHAGMAAAGNFTDYATAYDFMVEDTPSGYRAEIKLMVPARTAIEVTGQAGDTFVFGEAVTWQPVPLAERLELAEGTW
jgi:hypothetical protein